MSDGAPEAELSPAEDGVADEEETLRIVSVLGGSRRVGRWRIPSSTSVMALFGRTTLDLREAESQASEIEIRCLSVFAGVTILVPKGADVRPAGTAILASTSCDIPANDEPAMLPPVLISATTVLGKLHIQTEERPPRKPRRRGGQSRREPSWDTRSAITARTPVEANPDVAVKRTVESHVTVDSSVVDSSVVDSSVTIESSATVEEPLADCVVDSSVTIESSATVEEPLADLVADVGPATQAAPVG